ncbi:binding partner of ACD11 1 [Artemisia annua]|uniref:Binding partner of ACD11 1 n=1 Tax=Artemisia annua TaxID=35608 RepID=A0A2U1LSA4_ARTAN|nr:binding partner of ACD11 1 [Artemisia annua]
MAILLIPVFVSKKGTFTIASWCGTKVVVKKLGNELFSDKDKASHQENPYAYSAGEAVSMAQDVVKTMLAKGYILGKGALGKAKAFDESHQVSTSAAAKVVELSERYGITDKLCAGIEVVKSVDKNYHISNTTKSIVSATGRSAVAAATTVMNSNYFSKGSLWMSNALSRAAKAEECS